MLLSELGKKQKNPGQIRNKKDVDKSGLDLEKQANRAMQGFHEFKQRALDNIHNKLNQIKEKKEKNSKDNKSNKNDKKDDKKDDKKEDSNGLKKSPEERLIDGLDDAYPHKNYARFIRRKVDQGKADKYLKIFNKAETDAAGVEQVAEKLDRRKKILSTIFAGGVPTIIIVFIILAVVILLKNAASLIFGYNDGSVYMAHDPSEVAGVFEDYPGLYQEINKAVDKVSKEYKIEIDKYIIVASLMAPINNDVITPITIADDQVSPCKDSQCYLFNGEYKTWDEFVDLIGDQAELLAKMQLLTYTFESKCKSSEKTMEQYANNDDSVHEFPWWQWIIPTNWFEGYRNRADAEKNYVCTLAPNKNGLIPKEIKVLSLEKGKYKAIEEGDEITYDKDPNSGGVFYWNLVNKDGFLFFYLKDYLKTAIEKENGGKTLSDEELYEESIPMLLKAADDIYIFYEDIKHSCDFPEDYHTIIESKIEKIKVYNPPEKQSRFGIEEHIEIDFEDEYLGGVLLAEYTSGNDEALKAFAILARTEAIANVGVDGEKEIENSSNRQNYNPEYDINDEKYARLTKAVKDTRGIVVSDYRTNEVKHTEYDAFCPVRNTLDEGRWYYLPEGQQNLPIDVNTYRNVTGKEFIDPDSKWLKCPCFQNADGRPHDEIVTNEAGKKLYVLYTYSPSSAPYNYVGNPKQMTNPDCWTRESYTKNRDGLEMFGWSYKPTGGHGRGASQYGLTYFGAMGYDQDALLRLFFPGTQLRILRSEIVPPEMCQNIKEVDFNAENEIIERNNNGGGGSTLDDDGYNDIIDGEPLNKPLSEALAANGYTIKDLNKCIGDRVTAAGYGTRKGVVEAAVGLLECTSDMTGGYTLKYDHDGGKLHHPDINGKLGVNSNWGKRGGTLGNYGLNCATFARWSMCNGGLDYCDRGYATAPKMLGVDSTTYLTDAVKIEVSYGFRINPFSAPTDISSVDEALDKLQIGDMLFSNNGGNHHAMVIVGKTDEGVTIAENGKNTRKISYNVLKHGEKVYTLVLMDNIYENEQNNLSWEDMY